MPTAANKDFYQILGIKRSATAEEIRKAYRRLARKLHPDVNPNDKAAEERFKDVQEAYDVLGDPKKREFYDKVGFFNEQAFQQGAAGPFGGGAAGGPRPGGYQPPPNFDFGGFDFSDIFEPGGTGTGAGAGGSRRSSSFRDIFSNLFTQQGEGQAEVSGSDLEYQATIPFWDAIRGTVLRLSVPRQERCSQCNGTGAGGRSGVCAECNGKGQVTQAVGGMRFNLRCPSCGGTGKAGATCSRCHGQGRVQIQDSLEVRIKAGTREGARLRIPGKGNWGSDRTGDLYVIIHIQPHPLFQREGDDISITVPVTVTEAALGTKIEVPTIDGTALLKIPPGTQSGQRFRMRERGVPSAQREDVRGDQYVEIQVAVPHVQDERSKEILREFAQLNPQDVRGDLLRQAR
jgi:molecular chaperone DnaJ